MGGVNVIVTQETMQQVAQQLVTWDNATGTRHNIEYRTDGNLPYFHVPEGVCEGAPPLTLTPGGAVIACPTDGNPTVIQPTDDEVSGVDPNTGELIDSPSGLAVQGAPTVNSITMGWAAPDQGAAPTGYRLAYRQDGSTGSWTYLAVGGAQTTATASGLTAATAYDFKVQALSGSYSSAFTAEVTGTTAAA